MAGPGTFPKTISDIVYADDFNTIQSAVVGVLRDYYGKTPVSTTVAIGDSIAATPTSTKFADLKTDLDKVYRHISGAVSTTSNEFSGASITKNDWNAYYTAAQYCVTNKDTVYPSQLTLSAADRSDSMAAGWQNGHSSTTTFNWTSAAAATVWWNLQSLIPVNLAATSGGTGSTKDNMWISMLAALSTTNITSSTWNSATIGVPITLGSQTGTGSYTSDGILITATKTSTSQMDVSINLVTSSGPTTVSTNTLVLGGGGYNGSNSGDGGNGGQYIAGTMVLNAQSTYSVVVASVGGYSVFNGVSAAPGANGSDGYKHYWDYPAQGPDFANYPYWSLGGYGVAGNGGSGSGGPGGDGWTYLYDSIPSYYSWGGPGGSGVTWIDGNTYSDGGGGGHYDYNIYANEVYNIAPGGTGNQSTGGNGRVIIRYISTTQLFNGGDSIYTSGGYYFHVFTSSGTLSPAGSPVNIGVASALYHYTDTNLAAATISASTSTSW